MKHFHLTVLLTALLAIAQSCTPAREVAMQQNRDAAFTSRTSPTLPSTRSARLQTNTQTQYSQPQAPAREVIPAQTFETSVSSQPDPNIAQMQAEMSELKMMIQQLAVAQTRSQPPAPTPVQTPVYAQEKPQVQTQMQTPNPVQQTHRPHQHYQPSVQNTRTPITHHTPSPKPTPAHTPLNEADETTMTYMEEFMEEANSVAPTSQYPEELIQVYLSPTNSVILDEYVLLKWEGLLSQKNWKSYPANTFPAWLFQGLERLTHTTPEDPSRSRNLMPLYKHMQVSGYLNGVNVNSMTPDQVVMALRFFVDEMKQSNGQIKR